MDEFIPLPLPSLPVGGRLQYFMKFWKHLTSDPNILDMISGMPLELTDIPYR